jgi:hypothetical protein
MKGMLKEKNRKLEGRLREFNVLQSDLLQQLFTVINKPESRCCAMVKEKFAVFLDENKANALAMEDAFKELENMINEQNTA